MRHGSVFSSICVIPVQIKVNTLCTPKSKTHMAITSILYNPFEGRHSEKCLKNERSIMVVQKIKVYVFT